jgi:formylglycine-generating enzyme required for sulfatase activity
MDARPVTNAEYAEFVRANPLWRRSKVSRLYADTGYLKHWSSDLVPGASAPVDAPVVNVSWFAARAYARWRGERLPMTAEWERAAKVGYSSEDAEREPAMQEVLGQWLARPSEAPLPAADSGRPNKLGLWNMHGLVWEWVEDFDALLTTNESRSDPALEKELFCGAGSLLARDQGAYFSLLRAGFRSSLKAAYTMPNLGFRCVRSP